MNHIIIFYESSNQCLLSQVPKIPIAIPMTFAKTDSVMEENSGWKEISAILNCG